MARLGGIPTADRRPGREAGGAFLLAAESKDSLRISVGVGREFEIVAGNPYAILRCPNVTNAWDAFHLTYEHIYDGFDHYLAQTGLFDPSRQPLTLQNPFEHAILWWCEGDQQVLRVQSRTPIGLWASASLSVYEAAGNLVPQPEPPPPQVHASLDHLRLSQATDDLFEAFRQRYLAFERLLSWRIPSNPGEREGAWLKRALVEADNEAGVSAHCSPAWHDFATDFYEEIYQDVRCALFHAKEPRRVRSARRLADRALVQSALARLSQVFCVLYEEWLAIRLSSGSGHGEGFHAVLRSLLAEGGMIISADEAPLSDDESLADGHFTAGPTAPFQLAEPEWEPGVSARLRRFR